MAFPNSKKLLDFGARKNLDNKNLTMQGIYGPYRCSLFIYNAKTTQEFLFECKFTTKA